MSCRFSFIYTHESAAWGSRTECWPQEGSPNTLHGARGLLILYLEQTNDWENAVNWPVSFQKQVHIIKLPWSSHTKSVTCCEENSQEFTSCLFNSRRNLSGSVWWGDHCTVAWNWLGNKACRRTCCSGRSHGSAVQAERGFLLHLLSAMRSSNAHVSAKAYRKEGLRGFDWQFVLILCCYFLEPPGL